MSMVDEFIVYDNIQFSKRGWIHRNRILQNGGDLLFSLSLKKDSDYLDINQRFLSKVNKKNIEKIIRQIEQSYCKAPYFEQVMPLLIRCLRNPKKNLFDYIFDSIVQVNNYLQIETPITVSSTLTYDSSLRSPQLLYEICKETNATTYINPEGGKELYDQQEFAGKGISLKFMKMNDVQYPQFKNDFVASLSIIDVMMFNSVNDIQKLLKEYSLF